MVGSFSIGRVMPIRAAGAPLASGRFIGPRPTSCYRWSRCHRCCCCPWACHSRCPRSRLAGPTCLKYLTFPMSRRYPRGGCPGSSHRLPYHPYRSCHCYCPCHWYRCCYPTCPKYLMFPTFRSSRPTSRCSSPVSYLVRRPVSWCRLPRCRRRPAQVSSILTEAASWPVPTGWASSCWCRRWCQALPCLHQRRRHRDCRLRH